MHAWHSATYDLDIIFIPDQDWRFCKFEGPKGFLFDENKGKLDSFSMTSLQKKILRENPDLFNVIIGRSEIKEEYGRWELSCELEEKLISEGGEAIAECKIMVMKFVLMRCS